MKVHDILKIHDGDEFAADMVVLDTSDQLEGIAFVQTTNLDGESILGVSLDEQMVDLPPRIQVFHGVVVLPTRFNPTCQSLFPLQGVQASWSALA